MFGGGEDDEQAWEIGTSRSGDAVAGDVTRPEPWMEVVAEADVIVHTAALVTNAAQPTSRGRMWLVRDNVTRAFRRSARLVHVSSVAVYGHSFPGRVREDLPGSFGWVRFGDPKIAADHVVLQAVAAGEATAVIVRPSDV